MKLNLKNLTLLLISINFAAFIFISCTKESEGKETASNGAGNKISVKADTGTETAKALPDNLIKPDKNLKGAARCIACHPNEVKDWKGSHHEMAMKPAGADSIIADFNNTEFEHKGYKSKFYMKDGGYFVSTKNAKGEMQEFKVTHTFGLEPLQQYIVEFPNGRSQCLHIAWDAKKKTWYHLYGDMDIDHGEWLNWTGASQNWNSMCADCHSTELKKNFDPETDSYNTTFKEINVSCEACHGPADQHILAKLNPDAGIEKDPHFIGLKMAETPINKTEVEKCARCHSRRGQISDYYDHKGEFMDHYLPEILRDNIYHPDGQILDEVYVYGSFAQSKMYHQHNVRCTNCHNPHTAKLKMQGNDLCMQCHKLPGQNGVKDSSDVSNFYTTKAHHMHKEGTEAAQCINCHMTGKHYMGIDFRRDHSFRIPRPDQSVMFGTPNACSNCHKAEGELRTETGVDRDKIDLSGAKWAAEAVIKHYGKERRPHFSDLLLPGRNGERPQPHLLIQLARDKTAQPLARATAIWLLSNFAGFSPAESAAKELLQDKEPIVRFHAMAMFTNRKLDQKIAIYGPLLHDDIRAVRGEAANNLSDITQPDLLPEKYRSAFKKALGEYRSYMKFMADSPGGQMNISNFHYKRGEKKESMDALRNVIKIDSHFNQARMNLAYMLGIEKKYEEAEKVYLKVIEQEPKFPGGWYNLGILYTEMEEYEKADNCFNEAIIRQPRNLRIYLNRGLTLQKLKRYDEAEKVFYKAITQEGATRDPNAREIAYALILMQIDRGHLEKANSTLGSFVNIYGQKDPYIKEIGRRMGMAQKKLQNR